ncbi:MAG: YkgJ family cysteine cluster protein [Desulfovibrio sp.]|nr:YkgJ family cysteine cluster protein [Desulfovibrio sp.]
MENQPLSAEDTLDFINSLPEIAATETFCFDCNPSVPCFNQCCAELTLPLTPYDVFRLCRHLAMPSTDFMTTYTQANTDPETGFLTVTLKMNKEPGEPCPFVSPAGCLVYENRPSACRSYPLGRGTKLGEKGIIERFFVIHEEHCHGFDEGTHRTPSDWFSNQGLLPYNAANDRYMRLITLVKASGKPLDTRLSGMARLALYHIDQFRPMIQKMRIFTHLAMEEDRKALICQDSLEGDAACLDFAFDWMELLIFGQAPTLSRK